MPAFEVHDLKQDAVIWLRKGQDRHGLPVIGQPEEIRCRWLVDDSTTADPQGNTTQSSGSIIVSLKEEEVPVGSIMRKGKVCDVPNPPDKLHSVMKIDGIPDLKNRNQRVVLTVMSYTDVLPTVLTP